MKNIAYLERLRKLQLERLDVRRLRADLVLVYKIVFGLINQIVYSQYVYSRRQTS